MERVGLVSRVEEDLEREIALGLLTRDGFLPSEQVLARQQGVSRAVAREALLRLAARGLVVQHPGRRSRAVPLSEAVTLENLSMMLHGEDRPHPERRRLLEGYFSLKRETSVELLAACCEHASQEDLNRLEAACFDLQGTGPWEDQRRWVEREFELLRLAALGANRVGQFLLVRSLERSFWGMAKRLLPYLDCGAVRQWAWSAYQALCDRDARALRRDLPALLQAADDRLMRWDLLGALSQDRSADQTASSQTSPAGSLPLESEEGAPGQGAPNRSASHTGLGHTPPAEAPSHESEGGASGAAGPNRSACHTGSCQEPPTGAPSLAAEMMGRGTMGPNRSDCPTGSHQMPPARDASSESGATGARNPLGSTVPGAAWLPGHNVEDAARMWSPLPWALAPATAGDRAGSYGTASTGRGREAPRGPPSSS
jgi:GntR family transcriptional regulator, transcriptional repressor for pyruvate dehydrogenase complex